jgi:hypothetical protein
MSGTSRSFEILYMGLMSGRVQKKFNSGVRVGRSIINES